MISYWWKVFVNGKELVDTQDNGELENRRSCITGLSFSNPINGSDTVTIDIADPEMKFISDNIYIDDAPVTVQFGLNDTLFVKDFSGYISAIDIDFPESDTVTLRLTCMDESHRMHREKKQRSWENTTSFAVVEQIAQEYGFDVDIELEYPFRIEETISQDDKTDLELLEDLASNEDVKFYCKLVGNTIHYRRQGFVQTPVVGLTYRAYPYDLISFTPQITIEDKKEKESTSDINTATYQPQTTEVDSETADREVQGKLSPLIPKREPKGYKDTGILESDLVEILNKSGRRNQVNTYIPDYYPTTQTSKEDGVSKDANKIFVEEELSYLTGDCRVSPNSVTLATQAGNTVELKNLGPYISGMFYVKEVTFDITDSSLTYSVLRNGFGETLKPYVPVAETSEQEDIPLEVPEIVTFCKGDKVRFIEGVEATYTQSMGYGKIPDRILQQTHTVIEVSHTAGKWVLLSDNIWTYPKFLQKVQEE